MTDLDAWIKCENVFECSKDLKIFELDQELHNLDSWVSNTKYIIEFVCKLLSSQPEHFWSTLVHCQPAKLLLNGCLHFYSSNRIDFYLNVDNKEVQDLFKLLYQLILMTFVRILSNVDTEKLDARRHANLIITKKLLEVDILMKLSVIYGQANREILAELIGQLFKEAPKLQENLDKFIDNFAKAIERFENVLGQCVSLIESNPASSGVQSVKVMKIINDFTSIFITLASFFALYQPVESIPLSGLYTYIPKLICSIHALLSDRIIAQICSNNQTSISLLTWKRSRVLQLATHLFRTLYQSKTLSEEQRFKLIYENISRKEFLIRLDDDLNLKEEMEKFVGERVCLEEHQGIVERALEEAYGTRSDQIKESLAQQGTLKVQPDANLVGRPKTKGIDDSICDLADLMPDFSKEQLHLCLRHFGYDVEQTTHALCERELLPMNLRFILRKKDATLGELQTGIRIPPLTDDIQTACAEEPCSFAPAIQTTPLFDLAPTSSTKMMEREKELANANGQEQKVRKKMGQLVEKYGEVFDMTELKCLEEALDAKSTQRSTAEKDAVEIGGKLMVKREYLQKERQQLTAEEKAALRLRTKAYESDEDDGNYDDDEEEDERTRELKEARFAAEVGLSGRFNRPQLAQVFIGGGDAYDDEYDDTYDDALLYAPDSAAIEEKEDVRRGGGIRSSPGNRAQDHQDQKSGGSSSGAQKAPQKHQQKGQVKKQDGQSKKNPTTSAAGQAPQKQQPRPHTQEVPPPPGFAAKPAQQNSGGQGNANANGSTANSSSGAYTGGRSRQIKERNKGKQRQKGADRKARTGMF